MNKRRVSPLWPAGAPLVIAYLCCQHQFAASFFHLIYSISPDLSASDLDLKVKRDLSRHLSPGEDKTKIGGDVLICIFPGNYQLISTAKIPAKQGERCSAGFLNCDLTPYLAFLGLLLFEVRPSGVSGA